LQKKWSVAILLRTHKVSEVYERVLSEHGIPVTCNSDIIIAKDPMVAAFLSLIKLAAHPQDLFARNHLIMTPLKDIVQNNSNLSIDLLNDIYNRGYKYVVEKWMHCFMMPSDNFQDFRNFTNIRNLLDAAEQFDSLNLSAPSDFIDFISEYKIKPSANDGNVQIMTIHASKGLGFDLVFLPELDGKSGVNITKTDGLQIKKDAKLRPEWAFMMPNKNIAEALPGLSDYIKEKSEDQTYENLCVLYVAMTRAAKALYMIIDKCAIDKKSKSVHESDILLETLKNSTVEDISILGVADAELLYSEGDGNWFAKFAESEKRSEVPALDQGSTPLPLLNIEFSDNLKKITPSGNEPYITYAENLFSGASSNAMEFGSAVHEIFEFLTWSDTDSVDLIISQWQKHTSFSQSVQEPTIDLFKASLNVGEIYNALKKPNNQATLWREKDFSIIINNRWINGSFDRVVIERDSIGNILQATVIDYKTDKAENEIEIKEKSQIYAHQLNVYSEVLQAILKIDQSKIKTKLLFIRSGREIIL